jgi:hypothetical protein
LSQDARAARTYRDEVDILKEKASRADKHETEILKYKERLNELEFFKARVEVSHTPSGHRFHETRLSSTKCKQLYYRCKDRASDLATVVLAGKM